MGRQISDMKMNAIRSCIVVLGAVAFGYLSLHIGFKPFLQKAQQQQQQQQEAQQPSFSDHSHSETPTFSFSHTYI